MRKHSPPLFSIFIDPSTQTLHETSHSTLRNPCNQLFAEDVALFRAKPLFTRTNVFRLHHVGTFRWHAIECQQEQHFLNENLPALSSPLVFSNEPISCVEDVTFLGVSLTPNGITQTVHEERATKAEETLHTLGANWTQRARYLLSTFVRSQYTFTLHYTPLSKDLLIKDRSLLEQTHVALLRFRTPPTKELLKLLNNIFRIDSIQLNR